MNFSRAQTGNSTSSGHPVYRKLNNHRLFLSHVDVEGGYEAPWTMWGGVAAAPGTHLGNLKFGPEGARCPEHAKVLDISHKYIFLKKMA